MADQFAAPLVGPEVDLRDFVFMPLDVVRLRDSSIVVRTNGDEFRAAVLLWCASWHQLPAASLPDDDAALAQFAGYGRDIKGWKKVRDGAMRGWIRCSDGRLYHPVVAEKALESWKKKQEQRQRTLAARITKIEKKENESANPSEKQHLRDLLQTLRQAQQSMMTNSVTDSVTEVATESVTSIVTDSKGQVRDSKGTVKGQVRDINKHQHPVGLAPDGARGGKKANGAVIRASAIQILEFLNKKTGRAFQPVDTNLGPIMSLLKTGETTQDEIRQVIMMKTRKWGNDEKRREWLCPKTLFNRENYWNYQGQLAQEVGDAAKA